MTCAKSIGVLFLTLLLTGCMGSTVAKKQDVTFVDLDKNAPHVAGDINALRAKAVYGIIQKDDGQHLAKCIVRQSPTNPDSYKIDVVNSLPLSSSMSVATYAPLANGLDVLIPRSAAEAKQLKQLYAKAVTAKLEEQSAWRAAKYRLSAINDEGYRAYYGELFQIENFDAIYAVGESTVFIDYAGGEQIMFEDSSNIEKVSPENWYTFLLSKKQIDMPHLESVNSPVTGRTEFALYTDKYQAQFETTPDGNPSIKFKYQPRSQGSASLGIEALFDDSEGSSGKGGGTSGGG